MLLQGLSTLSRKGTLWEYFSLPWSLKPSSKLPSFKSSFIRMLQYFSELLNHLHLRVAALAKWAEKERSSQQYRKIQKTFELRYDVKDIEREVLKYLELEKKSNPYLLYKNSTGTWFYTILNLWTLISTLKLHTSLFGSDENMYSKIGQWGDGKKKF